MLAVGTEIYLRTRLQLNLNHAYKRPEQTASSLIIKL